MLTDWRDRAACRDADTDLFFPSSYGRPEDAETAGAKTFCRRCDVRFECLEYALAARIHDGIFGGFTARERLRIGRRRSA